jgi:transcriptional regulatory protein LEU3
MARKSQTAFTSMIQLVMCKIISRLTFECRFLKFYEPVVPGIIQSTLSNPDDVFRYSEVLFWVIVSTGARKYQCDPTLLESLQKPVARLAQHSLMIPDHATANIQAAIILCLWPLPMETLFGDPSHAIAGAAMQLAVQIGLPYPKSRQDFTRTALRHSANDGDFRDRLWVYCTIVFQRFAVPPLLS